jgi:hypothetical protein
MSEQSTSNQTTSNKPANNSKTWDGTVYMSNNINPYTVMPLAPNQVNGGTLTANILVSTIGSYTTGGTIQLLASMNVDYPNAFTYNGQAIYPYQIYSHYASAIASDALNNTGQFNVYFSGDPQLEMVPGEAFFRYNGGNDYNLTVDGYLSTSNSVGIRTPATSNYSLTVSGEVLFTGSVNLAGVKVASLGIGGAIPSGSIVFDVSGDSKFFGSTSTTGNSLVGGNVAIGKLSAANAALDVSGSAIISSNLTVSSNAFIRRLAIGKPTIASNLSVDISGNTRIAGSLAVSSNLDISNNSTIRGGLTILGQGTLTSNYSLNVIGNVHYTNTLSGPNGLLSGTLEVGSAIGIGKYPDAAQLDVVGSGVFTQNLTALNQINTSNLITGGYIATPNLSIGQGDNPPFYSPFQVNGDARIIGHIGLNIQDLYTPLPYEFDMSGVLNTTQLISSNIYATNIYGPTSNPYGAPNTSNTIMVYGNVVNNASIQSPSVIVGSFISSNYALTVSGDVLVAGNITSTTPVYTIQYTPLGNSANWRPPLDGWRILPGTSTVDLILPPYPATYIIDGSGGGAQSNLLVTLYPFAPVNISGITDRFIARNTTGLGHQLIYPYSNGSGLPATYPTYSQTFAAPLNISLLGVGPNDYSST